MKRALTVLGAVGVGAWFRYFFDPKRRHHSPGVTSLSEEPPREQRRAPLRGISRQRAGDDVLTGRIQAKLAMVVRQPHRITVRAVKGRVTLHGAAGADEIPHLLRIVEQIPGVTGVEQALNVRDDDGGSGRSGLIRAAREKSGLLSGATGGALAVYGLRKRSLAGAGIAAVGLGLIASGLNHQDVRRLLGLKERARRRAEEWGRSKQPEAPVDGARAAAGRSAAPDKVLRLKDIMTYDVEVLRPDVAVETAAEAMRRLDIGAIPVCDGRRMVGILTDRDIVVRTIAEKRDTRSMLVADVMTTDVVCGLEDDLVEEAALKMVERRIRRLPVLNGDRELVGIVSLGDLAVHGLATTLTGEVIEYISQPAEPKRAASIGEAADTPSGWNEPTGVQRGSAMSPNRWCQVFMVVLAVLVGTGAAAAADLPNPNPGPTDPVPKPGDPLPSPKPLPLPLPPPPVPVPPNPGPPGVAPA